METVAQMIAILETAIDADGNIIPGAAAKYREIMAINKNILWAVEPGIAANIDHIMLNESRLREMLVAMLTFLRNV